MNQLSSDFRRGRLGGVDSERLLRLRLRRVHQQWSLQRDGLRQRGDPQQLLAVPATALLPLLGWPGHHRTRTRHERRHCGGLVVREFV